MAYLVKQQNDAVVSGKSLLDECVKISDDEMNAKFVRWLTSLRGKE